MSVKNGKPCKKCGGNEWHKNGRCAVCSRAYDRIYKQANREKIRERDGEYREANRDKRRQQDRQYKLVNRERRQLSNRLYKQTTADKKRQQDRQYKIANRERHRESTRRWARKNPDAVLAIGHRRRTKIKGSGGSYTAAEWKDLCNFYGNKCLCCGRSIRLTADHIIPVSKGGSSNIDNIQCLCLKCNLEKGVKTTDYRPGKYERWIQKPLFG